jgi:hypothetical protein
MLPQNHPYNHGYTNPNLNIKDDTDIPLPGDSYFIPAGTKFRHRFGPIHFDGVQQRSRWVTTKSVESFLTGRVGISWKSGGYKKSCVI